MDPFLDLDKIFDPSNGGMIEMVQLPDIFLDHPTVSVTVGAGAGAGVSTFPPGVRQRDGDLGRGHRGVHRQEDNLRLAAGRRVRALVRVFACSLLRLCRPDATRRFTLIGATHQHTSILVNKVHYVVDSSFLSCTTPGRGGLGLVSNLWSSVWLARMPGCQGWRERSLPVLLLLLGCIETR